MKLSVSANQLKLIAIASMTIDHAAFVVYPGYPTDWWLVLLHIIGRMAAPIFWFFIAEGYHHSHNRRKYALRLLLFAVIGHFAYNFAFGISFIPFQDSVLNQTSVMWPLFWGLAALMICHNNDLKQWQKTLLIVPILLITFCSDWSCIAVLAIMSVGCNRGNFKKQMTGMMLWTGVYALIYAFFANPLYGLLQLFVAIDIPLLKAYNGQRGHLPGLKQFFYIYYPLHLFILGLVRLAVHG